VLKRVDYPVGSNSVGELNRFVPVEQSNVVSDVREPEVPGLRGQDSVASEDAVGDVVHVLHARAGAV